MNETDVKACRKQGYLYQGYITYLDLLICQKVFKKHVDKNTWEKKLVSPNTFSSKGKIKAAKKLGWITPKQCDMPETLAPQGKSNK